MKERYKNENEGRGIRQLEKGEKKRRQFLTGTSEAQELRHVAIQIRHPRSNQYLSYDSVFKREESERLNIPLFLSGWIIGSQDN